MLAGALPKAEETAPREEQDECSGAQRALEHSSCSSLGAVSSKRSTKGLTDSGEMLYDTPHQRALECRSTVGLPTLDRPIGVRIPALQPAKRGFYNLSFLRSWVTPELFTCVACFVVFSAENRLHSRQFPRV